MSIFGYPTFKVQAKICSILWYIPILQELCIDVGVVNIVVILWIYYQDISCMLYVYIIHTWLTQHTYFIQICWITCLLSLNLVWNIQHVHNMNKNWMNKLAGDLINMLKNSNRVGIGGEKVLTGPWIVSIYPNVFNVC